MQDILLIGLRAITVWFMITTLNPLPLTEPNAFAFCACALLETRLRTA